MLFNFFDHICWLFWRYAAKEMPQEQLGTCVHCGGPVYPGQVIAVTTDDEPMHAGHHYTLKSRQAFCETAALGSAVWTKEGKPEPLEPKLLEDLVASGKLVVDNQ